MSHGVNSNLVNRPLLYCRPTPFAFHRPLCGNLPRILLTTSQRVLQASNMAEVSLGPSALFEYTPLPSEEPAIRLITLLPNSIEENVECVLKNHVWDIDTGHVSADVSDNDLRSTGATTPRSGRLSHRP